MVCCVCMSMCVFCASVCICEHAKGKQTTEAVRGREGREGREGGGRLLLESVKTIMQTDTSEIRCRLPWQQALGEGATRNG